MTRAHRRAGRRLLSAAVAPFALVALVVAGVVAVPTVAASAAPVSAAVAVPRSQTVLAGGTARFSFAYRAPRGTVFRIAGLPVGASVGVRKLTSARYQLVVTVAATAPSSRSTIRVTTRARPNTVVTSAVLQVVGRSTPQPPATVAPTTPTVPPSVASFTIRADNPALTVATSQTAVYGISVDRSGGYTGGVNFTATGVPAGTSSNFAPNPTTGGTNFYVTPSASTPDGNYAITVSASGGTTVRTASLVLSVQTRPDFALSVPPSTTMSPGAVSYVAIPYRPLTATVPTVALNISGLPLGVTASFTPNPTFGQTTLTLTTSASVTPGSYPLVITATAGAVTHQYPHTLVVAGPPDFALGVPASATVVRGVTSYVVIGFQALSPTVPTVALNVSGLPTGMTATFTPNPTFGQTTLVVTPSASVAPGSYALVITGTAGTVVHQYALTLVVTATAAPLGTITIVPVNPSPGGLPGYGLGATPGALSVLRGSSGTVAVSITPTGGFTSPIQLSMTGLPAGSTVAATNPSANTASFTFTVPAATAPGTYSVTVNGTSGTLSANIVLSVTVT